MRGLKLNFLISIFIFVLFRVQIGYGQNLLFGNDNAKSDNNLTSNILRFEDYTFSKSTETYTELTGATILSFNTPWDDPQVLLPIGFPFRIYDKTVDSIVVRDGFCGLSHRKISQNHYEYDYTIAAFMADLIDRGFKITSHQSPISYKLEGNPGSRILKIEWKNAGFYDEMDSVNTTDDYINFQLWLFESTNKIEIHFGPNSVMKPEISYEDGGAWILIADLDFYNLNIYTDTNFKIILLNGNPLNPTIITEYQADSTTPLSGTPSNGTIYRFTKNVNTINYPININDDLYIFPNPASEELKISIHNHDFELQPIHIKVLDMFGRILVEKNVLNYDNSKVIPINISQIPNGPYILHLSTNNIILNQKFIKR